jgi:pimeloyl-ACP methyl ester carboxylesterase
VVRVERPQASRRSSHEPLCRTGCVAEETAICVFDGTGRIVREMRMPLAILSGDMDAIVDARDHPCRLHQQVAHSTLTLLPGLGHMIHYSAKAQIGRAVDSLMGLARTRPTRSRRASPSTFASGRPRL